MGSGACPQTLGSGAVRGCLPSWGCQFARLRQDNALGASGNVRRSPRPTVARQGVKKMTPTPAPAPLRGRMSGVLWEEGGLPPFPGVAGGEGGFPFLQSGLAKELRGLGRGQRKKMVFKKDMKNQWLKYPVSHVGWGCLGPAQGGLSTSRGQCDEAGFWQMALVWGAGVLGKVGKVAAPRRGYLTF